MYAFLLRSKGFRLMSVVHMKTINAKICKLFYKIISSRRCDAIHMLLRWQLGNKTLSWHIFVEHFPYRWLHLTATRMPSISSICLVHDLLKVTVYIPLQLNSVFFFKNEKFSTFDSLAFRLIPKFLAYTLLSFVAPLFVVGKHTNVKAQNFYSFGKKKTIERMWYLAGAQKQTE